MSSLRALLEVLKPSDIDFRELGTLGRRNKGTPITAAKMKVLAKTPGPIRVFAGGQTIADVAESAVPDGHVIRVPSIIVKSRGNIDFTYYDRPFTHKAELWSYTINDPAVNQKFVFYYLLTQVPKLQELARATSVKLPQLSVRDTDSLRIPLPRREVQDRIVEALDQFAELRSSLQEELDARRQQFQYYRSELLARAAAGADWSTLGGVSSRVSSGATPRAGAAEYYKGGTIPWLRTGEVTFGEIWDTEMRITERALKETAVSWIEENCVVVAISGATAARSAINKIPLTTNQHCCNLQIDGTVADYRYVFHWVASKYEELKAFGRGARSDLNTQLIKDFPIPVPSVPEQQRVVAQLESFDALVNSGEDGLPAELAARSFQYKYYLESLLDFRGRAL